MIANRGVNNFSLRDVALEAELSRGTLYYHYTTKDDIIFDVIAQHIDSLKAEYLLWLKRHENDLRPERFLEVVFHKGVKLFDRAKMHVFLINECLGDNSTLRKKFLEKYKEWRETLLVGVRKVFIAIEDPEAFAYTLMLIIDGLVIQEVLRSEPFDEKRLVRAAIAFGGE